MGKASKKILGEHSPHTGLRYVDDAHERQDLPRAPSGAVEFALAKNSGSRSFRAGTLLDRGTPDSSPDPMAADSSSGRDSGRKRASGQVIAAGRRAVPPAHQAH
ncbi:hypothetical protein DL764_009732 [Monosporascus ibericus]|uniref:Uncharacterized protein n=1 Tax=Monosporascus ibericus TaxID=155417 RepID=A0A4Q4SWK0_9PEZI|nr:hypothetical protein DL764_009732 [Monosporascus ibericus]